MWRFVPRVLLMVVHGLWADLINVSSFIASFPINPLPISALQTCVTEYRFLNFTSSLIKFWMWFRSIARCQYHCGRSYHFRDVIVMDCWGYWLQWIYPLLERRRWVLLMTTCIINLLCTAVYQHVCRLTDNLWAVLALEIAMPNLSCSWVSRK